MIKIYGSINCPYCKEAKEKMKAKNIPFEAKNFEDALINLKTFIRQRDKDPQFDDAKREGRIGIPALLLDDGTWISDWRSYIGDQSEKIEPGQACGLDGRGC